MDSTEKVYDHAAGRRLHPELSSCCTLYLLSLSCRGVQVMSREKLRLRYALFPLPHRAVVLLCSAVLLAASASFVVQGQQNPAETLTVEATDVVVDVIVTDRNGHHVPGLTAKDFTVLEDGVPQKIASFSESRATELPPAGSPDSQAKPLNSAPLPTTVIGHPRLLTVVMDLSDTRPENLRKSGDAVVKYLEKKLSPNDYVAIYYLDRALRLALPFTTDLEHARTALATLGSTTSSSPLSPGDRGLVQNQIDELYARLHPE